MNDLSFVFCLICPCDVSSVPEEVGGQAFKDKSFRQTDGSLNALKIDILFIPCFHLSCGIDLNLVRNPCDPIDS